MKLVRYGDPGAEKPGLVDDAQRVFDLSGEVADVCGDTLDPGTLDRLRNLDTATLPLVGGSPRLGSCVPAPGKFIGIGLNFSDHAREANQPIPEEPVVFFKTDTCVCGPFDNVISPPGSSKLDWEVELGVVIGSEASHVDQANAERHIAGYCVVNDVSERAYQIDRGGGQWGKGKGCDTFGPVGPWLVTRDEVPDVQNLDMWLDVNGDRMQSGNTGTMIFGAVYLVSYLSRFMTLRPGDIITTGTPPGVALGMTPPKWLKPGDVMSLGIEGLGVQRQTVVEYPGATPLSTA